MSDLIQAEVIERVKCFDLILIPLFSHWRDIFFRH